MPTASRRRVNLTPAQQAAQQRRNLRRAQNDARKLVKTAVARNTPRRSGALMNSTSVTFQQTAGTIKQTYYGEFVNFGTRFITPRSFVERAVTPLAPKLANIRRKFDILTPFRLFYFNRRVGGG